MDKKIQPGRLVGVGGEHLVREWGEHKVIKTPLGLRFRLNPKKFKVWLPRDYVLAKRYFGGFVLDAKIQLEDTSYCIVQNKIASRPLTVRDLKNEPALREQFFQIVDANKKMIRAENLSWDFYGAMGLIHISYDIMTNLVVAGQRLKMIDFGMLYLAREGQNWLVYLITRWAFRRQNKYLSRVLSQI